MFEYIVDFTLVALLVIGITAILGVLTNGIGEKVFGGGKGDPESFNHSAQTQNGWNQVGGKKRNK
ncbi:hypothetical protein ACFSCX_01965 [Bacillus salitolerans]|uniref:Uncharacterized protein n=1 Tax=Bacillus salitolerans TaxID=1437434 RepID=A0ABW4LJB3_9BACI